MAEPLDTIKASELTLARLAATYAAEGFEVEWLGLEDQPERRQELIRRSEHGCDWFGEDDRLVLRLMLSRPGPEPLSTCVVEVMADNTHLRLFTARAVRPGASRAAVCRYVNRVNRRLKLLRAYPGAGEVVFDYWLLLTFGVGRAALAESTEFFMRVAWQAQDELDREDLLG